MTTISFKAEEDFKKKLEILAKKNGITTSAYIKLTLTKSVNGELTDITENGLTVGEELEILDCDQNDKTFGPFTGTKAVMIALKKKK